MSFPTTSHGSPVSHHLRATKKILRDVVFDAKTAMSLEKAEVDALERDAFEVLRLVRFWKNRFAPASKIPPEILALVPDFLDLADRDGDVITLTHVCRTWREVFVSRSSLWTDFECKDGDKTRVYLKRSRSSPINLSLYRYEDISPCDPLFWVIPHAIGRLRSLSIKATPENIQTVTPYLSHPAPLLEHLTVDGDCEGFDDHPALTSALFDGDLSSLRTLHLESVRTELPWRNMVNLTSFTLAYMLPEEVAIGKLLDFFEDAPHLCEVNLRFATPTTGAQSGRLVSLGSLKSMYIAGGGPPSVLLDHLVIPVGAGLTTRVGLHGSLIGEHLPRSLSNLKNLSDFTTIQIYLKEACPRMKFSGPNGEVTTIPTSSRADRTGFVLESLTQLDTSKAERLEIDGGNPLSRNHVYQALLPMTYLRTLVLSECMNLHIFIRALHPGMGPSEAVVCPRLEELVFVLHLDGNADEHGIRSVVGMAVARASREKKLRTLRIVDEWHKVDPEDILELKKHVWNVEHSCWSSAL